MLLSQPSNTICEEKRAVQNHYGPVTHERERGRCVNVNATCPLEKRAKTKVERGMKIYRKFTPFNSTFTSFCDNVSQDEKEP